MSSKITVTLDGNLVSEHVLDKETITIGRKSSNDIHLDSIAVSGRHCQILNILNDSYLEDLDSTNGTFVNGNRVKKYALSDKDVIVVGRHHLRFTKDEQALEEEADERTVAMSAMAGGASEAGVPPPSPQPPPPPPPQAQEAPPPAAAPITPPGGQYGSLQLLNTSKAGKTMELVKPVTTIGKPGSQVAAITLRKDGYYIVVVDSGGGSAAPPSINSEPMGSRVLKLNNNDVIEIAGVKLLYSN